MKVAPVQLLLFFLHLAGGEPEGTWRGEGNGWGEDLPVLSQRELNRERLGIQFPFIKVKIMLKINNLKSLYFRINLEKLQTSSQSIRIYPPTQYN